MLWALSKMINLLNLYGVLQIFRFCTQVQFYKFEKFEKRWALPGKFETLVSIPFSDYEEVLFAVSPVAKIIVNSLI